MIICFIGNIGSGKTLSVVKKIIDSKDNYAITNFRLKYKDYYRLKYQDILLSEEKKGHRKFTKVNWEFWEAIRKKHKNFSIFLDEAHNLIHSRASMTKRNILLSQWVSQIRKVLSDSPENHLYIITQTPRKIDINFRELTHVVVKCTKLEIKDKIYIVQKYFNGFGGYETRSVRAKTFFCGNPYFKFYDSYDLVRFSDAEEYI